MIPQIILIVLWAIGLGVNLHKHGKVEEQKSNIFIKLLVVFIYCLILHYGGFWDVFYN